MGLISSFLSRTIAQRLQKRADVIDSWIEKNGRECKDEQKHTVANTPERLYWHYGYVVALKDVISLLTRKTAELN